MELQEIPRHISVAMMASMNRVARHRFPMLAVLIDTRQYRAAWLHAQALGVRWVYFPNGDVELRINDRVLAKWEVPQFTPSLSCDA